MAAATTPVPTDARGATLLRLILVFLLGVLSALLFSPLDLPPWWIQPAAFLLALLAVDAVVLVVLSGFFLWLHGL
jgi:hypothetical protein